MTPGITQPGNMQISHTLYDGTCKSALNRMNDVGCVRDANNLSRRPLFLAFFNISSLLAVDTKKHRIICDVHQSSQLGTKQNVFFSPTSFHAISGKFQMTRLIHVYDSLSSSNLLLTSLPQ